MDESLQTLSSVYVVILCWCEACYLFSCVYLAGPDLLTRYGVACVEELFYATGSFLLFFAKIL